MPEVIHDLNLRNIVGRIIHVLLQDGLVAQMEAVGCPSDLARLANDYYKKDVQGYAGATAIWLQPERLPLPELWSVIEDWSWFRLPFPSLWCDIKKVGHGADYSFHVRCIDDVVLFLGKGHTWDTRENPALLVHSFISHKGGGLQPYFAPIFVGRFEDRGAVAALAVDPQTPSWPFWQWFYDHTGTDGGGSNERAIMAYISKRVSMVLFAINAISNVSLQKVAPAHKIPKHERKYPRMEYHILKIRSNRNGTISPSLKEQLRQSPRQHLRRGHLRRFSNPKFTKPYTWIPPCIVGDAGRGSIVKDYLL